MLHKFCVFAVLYCPVFCLGQSFTNPKSIPVDGYSGAVSVADLDGDGHPDLIVSLGNDVSSMAIETFLGDGAGNFRVGSKIAVPTGASSVCRPVDMNGDKRIDLVCPPFVGTTSNVDAIVVTFFGNGDGTFQAPVTYDLQSLWLNLEVIAAADFNGDGHTDLLLSDYAYNNNNFLLLGDGTGQFTKSTPLGTLGGGKATVVDVNGDGIADLVTALGPRILLGKGDGTFPTANIYGFFSCVPGDFEKTGKLSVACAEGNLLRILHMNADGTLNQTPVASMTIAGAQVLQAIAAVDLNGDGILDLALRSQNGLEVMMGGPGMTFTGPIAYAAGGTTTSVYQTGVFSDLNGDGRPDFVAAGPNAAYISYGTSSGNLDAPILTQLSTKVYSSVVADYNGDGNPDVATVIPEGIDLLFSKADGTLGAPTLLALPSGYSLDLSQVNLNLLTDDFNGDGKKDFLVPAGLTSTNLMFLGNGDGTFAAAVPVSTTSLPSVVNSRGGAVVADINGDHRDDIVEPRQNSLDVYLAQADGSFLPVSTALSNPSLSNVSAGFADFDGDGELDAAINFSDHVSLYKGNGDGTFTATGLSLTSPAVAGWTSFGNIDRVVEVGDFDGDGKLDIAVLALYSTPIINGSGGFSSAAWVYYGGGDGTFSQAVSAGLFPNRTSFYMASAPMSGSGRSDLVIAGDASGTTIAAPISVITSLPGRTFSTETMITAGSAIDSVHLADFNHDGRFDLLVSNGPGVDAGIQYQNTIALLLNQGSLIKGTLTTSPQPSYGGNNYTATVILAAPVVPGQLSGNVSFVLDGKALSSVPLSNDTAALTISTNLAAGDHTLTANWPGDSTYWPVTLTATHSVQDFSLSADPSISIQTEYHASFGVHLASLNGFSDDVTLSCSGLPAYASCTFANPTVHLSANQKVDTQVTIDTDSVLGYKAQQERKNFFGFEHGVFVAAVLPFWVLVGGRKRLRRCALVAAAGVVLLAGCGGKGGGGGSGGTGSTPSVPNHTAAGTYTITITARGSASQVVHTANVSLVVTP